MIMTIKQSLIWANKKLRPLACASHNDTPALDAEILLAFVLGKPKEFLYAHSEKKITANQLNQFKKIIARRAKHEPVAYITGHKEFFGLDFFVNKNVLIPRPETELLVEETLKKIQNTKYKIQNTLIIDVGTGSGCIAVSLAYQLPHAKICATEISSGAIKVARKNIKHHKVTVTLLCGNLLKPIIKKIENCKLKIKNLIVTANLPYLTTKQWYYTQPEIKKYEPRLALDGGPDGLKYHKQLLKQIKKIVTGYKLQVTSLIEIDPSQAKPISKLIKNIFPTAKLQIKKDLAGRDRIILFHIQNN